MRVLYKLIRPLLFCLPAEYAHRFSLRVLSWMVHLGYEQKIKTNFSQVMGLSFPNRIGISAGLDKNAEFIDTLGKLGVGFIEVGSVSIQSREGNPKPRVFRVPEKNALINRIGLANVGIKTFVDNIKKRRFAGVIGVNLTKNKETASTDAVDDYCQAMADVYPYAGYITINISCPAETGLRDLQFGTELQHLLKALKTQQAHLNQQHRRYVPITIKISPDLSAADIALICKALLAHKIDGLIATNTTTQRAMLGDMDIAHEAGGLSGAPLFPLALAIVKQCYQHLQGQIPIIAVGGIRSQAEALAMFTAGAELIQVYTGLVYEGPTLIRELILASQRFDFKT